MQKSSDGNAQSEAIVKGGPETEIHIDEEVIDCDAHIRETVDDMIPYIEDKEAKSYVESEYFDYPWDGWDRSAGGRAGYATVHGPEDEAQVMEDLSLDISILSPTKNLYHGLLGNKDVAVALARAYNKFILDEWLDESEVFKSGIFVPVQDPEVGAELINEHGHEDDMVCVFLNPVGPEKALGDERYDPVYEAAERHNLPIALHGGATTHSQFPLQTNYFHKFLEVHAISHPFQQMAQITSILCRGVPAKYPDLNFITMEAGLGWLPYIYRLDKEFLARRNEAPLLEKLPSEYFQEQFYAVSQPLEETANVEYLAELAGGWDRLLFATDWPHWDFDSPTVIQEMFPKEHWSKVYHENARRAFDL